MMNHQTTGSRDQWSILKILQWTTGYFQKHNVESPRASAEILLAHALGIRRIDLYLKYDQPLHENELAPFKASIKRRIRNEPVAYIVGVREFWSLDFFVTPNVLIPRPETECLVEETLRLEAESTQRRPLRILELGTGSGAVIVALAHEKPANLYFASDRSAKALSIARKNADRHRLAEKIRFFAGNWCDPLRKAPWFDIIVSNPPYVRKGDIVDLQPEIADYEPVMALDGDIDGLKCLRRLIREAPGYLVPGGHLVLEMGWDQGAAVVEMGVECGFYEENQVGKDYSGHDRIVRLKKRAIPGDIP